MMKTNKFLGIAALACGFALSFTSCANEDNLGDDKMPVTIGFENQELNADGFWRGGDGEASSAYIDESGNMVTVNSSEYEENMVMVRNAIRSVHTESGSVSSWLGFAISSRTETSFAPQTLTPDLYNNVVGSAHSGKNFLVAQNGLDNKIFIMNSCKVRGFWYTNSAGTVYSIENGDNKWGAPFDATDWLTCTVTGFRVDGTTASVDIDLASNGTYVADWKYCNLSSLGEVTELQLTFSSSRSDQYGLICIDDLTIEN